MGTIRKANVLGLDVDLAPRYNPCHLCGAACGTGVVVSLALTRSPYPIGKVYGADWNRAAMGCIGALVLLNMTSGPTAVLWVGAVIGLAALGFANSRPGNFQELLCSVPRCFATGAASSQDACSLRLPTRSRSMAFVRRSSRTGWKCRPILPTISAICFPYHRRSKLHRPTSDVGAFAALPALDDRAAMADD